MKNLKNLENIEIIQIDLFCGAGGVTTGSELAAIDNKKVCKVIAAVNHDKYAIQSHQANHSDVVHFTEDIRTLNLSKLKPVLERARKLYPSAKLLLWASLECTNFSKAKGGLPREADSRTLAEHLFRYIDALNPDIIKIENVEEFMCWGPLDENGKPLSRYEGRDYLKWVSNVKKYGYDYDYRILNCADFGDYTARKRYFGQFVKYGLPISWPTPTHSKQEQKDMFGTFKKWKPVKDVLDLHDEGVSIFEREKTLCDKTIERILAGCKKFVVNGEKSFISKYNSNRVDKPSSGIDINKPCPTVTCQNRLAIVNTSFLAKYYGNGDNVQSLNSPAGTVRTKDTFSYISTKWLDKQYGTGNCQSLNSPSGTLTNIPKLNLVSANHKKQHYLIDTQFKNNGKSIENPCPTIIARQDKKPLYLISMQSGIGAISLNSTDSKAMKELKYFMNEHGIYDIKMRMLKVKELLLITGFPEDYILKGSLADQKKFIGNAVPTNTVKAWIESTAYNLKLLRLKKVA